jgi:hypothetical protein
MKVQWALLKRGYYDGSIHAWVIAFSPAFSARQTLLAAAGRLFFRVARSTRMTQIWALRLRLEKQPTDLRRNSRDLGDGTLGR